MSLPAFERALRVEPQRSQFLTWFLIANFSGATLLLFIVSPLLLAVPLSVALWGYFYQLYRHHILRTTPRSIRLLVRELGGEWFLHTFDGAQREVTLSPSSYLHPYLIILILQAGRERMTLPLLPDSLSAGCFRALSVRLRTERAEDDRVAR